MSELSWSLELKAWLQCYSCFLTWFMAVVRIEDASKTTENLLCMLAPPIHLGSPFCTANTVEGLVKLLHTMMSGRCLEVWHFGPNPNFSEQIHMKLTVTLSLASHTLYRRCGLQDYADTHKLNGTKRPTSVHMLHALDPTPTFQSRFIWWSWSSYIEWCQVDVWRRETLDPSSLTLSLASHTLYRGYGLQDYADTDKLKWKKKAHKYSHHE